MLIQCPGDPAFLSEDAARHMEAKKTANDAKRRCYQCLEEVEPSRMRNHVAEHILRAVRGVSEDLRGQHVSYLYSARLLSNLNEPLHRCAYLRKD